MNVSAENAPRPVKRPLTPAVLMNYTLVGLMLACLAYAINHILARIFLGWDGWFIPLLAFFVAVEATITYRQLRQSVFSFGERVLWRVTEGVVLAFFLKLALYGLHNPADLLTDLVRWQEDFLAAFFTGATIITFGIAVIIWLAASTFAEVLYDLEENTEEWDLERQGVAVKNREVTRQSLMAHVFGYGALLLAITAFLNLDVPFLPDQVQGVTIPTLVFVLYFVLGLILLAQAQFSVQRARWYLHDIPSSPVILSRWLRYSMMLVLAIGMIVIFLPTGYAISVFDLLQVLLSVVVFIGLVLQFLILTPLLLLLGWLSELFGAESIIDVPEPIPPQPPPPPPTGDGLPWLEVLQSILFWLLLAAVVFFSFRHYLRQHGGLFAGLSKTAPFRWARAFWRWLQASTGSVSEKMQQAIRAGIDLARQTGVRAITAIPSRELVFGRLPPRQQVLLTYLNLLFWLKQNGVERKNSSTPQEYARQLIQVLPESHEDIDRITHLFVEARYSMHPITGEQSSEARTRWDRIRQQFLRQIEQPREQDGSEVV